MSGADVCLATDPADDGGVIGLRYVCTLDRGHGGEHDAEGHTWAAPAVFSSFAGLGTFRGRYRIDAGPLRGDDEA